jgi:hypothetical protein
VSHSACFSCPPTVDKRHAGSRADAGTGRKRPRRVDDWGLIFFSNWWWEDEDCPAHEELSFGRTQPTGTLSDARYLFNRLNRSTGGWIPFGKASRARVTAVAHCLTKGIGACIQTSGESRRVRMWVIIVLSHIRCRHHRKVYLMGWIFVRSLE